MEDIKFDDLFPSRKEVKLLKEINLDGQPSDVNGLDYLIKNHLITHNLFLLPDASGYCGDGKYYISETGKRYLLYYKQRKSKEKAKEIRAWITAAIAIGAFVKSFFFIG